MHNSEEHRNLMCEFECMGKARIDELAQLDKNANVGKAGTIQGLNPENYDRLKAVAERAQNLILEYRALHGSVEGLRKHLIDHMRLNLYQDQDVMPRVAAYALSAGTTNLAAVIELLNEDLSIYEVFDIRMAYQERCHDKIEKDHSSLFHPPLPAQFILEGGHEAYKALYPALLPSACFQIIDAAKSGELPGNRFHNLVALLKNENDVGEEWAKKVTDDVAYLIGQRPVDPLMDLRLEITGSKIPSNRECSQRLHHAIASIMSPNGLPAHEGTMEDYAKIIRDNEFYYDKLLVQDLTEQIKREVDENEDNPSQDFDYGVESFMRLSAFLKALRLSDAELSVVALMAVQEISLGSAYDLALENPAVGAISMSKLLFKRHTQVKEGIETDVKKSIAFGLWQAMSQFAMGQALQHDAGKYVMYKITNNPQLLNGLKNKKLLDEAFGADLGL
ncbi:hypothetical protein [Pseudomonas viridiflava]|uniref:hypothetical protein n=1 Tax=Pseudomonas viridiflava TaxID=33069 RepID=UPI000F0449A5|nr:hypothetical protein [Pseudomonas viridiflava]MBD8615672.1 hypothetical protein [Pseudomonas putida]